MYQAEHQLNQEPPIVPRQSPDEEVIVDGVAVSSFPIFDRYDVPIPPEDVEGALTGKSIAVEFDLIRYGVNCVEPSKRRQYRAVIRTVRLMK